MKRKLLGALLLMLTLGLAVSSCKEEEDKYTSKLPTFDTFLITDYKTGNDVSSFVQPGQEIKVVAHQAEIGKLIYSATYRWGVKTPNEETTVKVNGSKSSAIYDNDTQDPYIVFVVPDDGSSKMTVTLRAEYEYTGHGDIISSGKTYEDDNARGTFSPSSGSTSGVINASLGLKIVKLSN